MVKPHRGLQKVADFPFSDLFKFPGLFLPSIPEGMPPDRKFLRHTKNELPRIAVTPPGMRYVERSRSTLKSDPWQKRHINKTNLELVFYSVA
jgi:hypothetical protein